MELIKATETHWQLLLKWRNDTLTRQNSLNSRLIDITEHKRWFFESLENPNRIIYIAKEKNEPIGTLRVDVKGDVKTISWAVAEQYREKGYAKRMVKKLTDNLKGELVAIIKEGNIASVKVAEYAGFSFFNKQNNILTFTRNINEDR